MPNTDDQMGATVDAQQEIPIAVPQEGHAVTLLPQPTVSVDENAGPASVDANAPNPLAEDDFDDCGNLIGAEEPPKHPAELQDIVTSSQY